MTTARRGRFAGLDIVWLQSPPWHGVWTRQNHFARRLAADGARILYVENPVAIRARIKAGRRAAAPQEVEPGITVMELPLQLPGSRTSSLIGAINGHRFAGAVKRESARLGFGCPLVWCRLPAAIHTLERLAPRGVVYDVTDDYDYYATSEAERALTRRREQRLAARANQIFTTSEELRTKLCSLASTPVTPVSNGVDSMFFDDSPRDDPLQDVPHPRIGFVGLVASWMDFDLLSRLAAKWPKQVVIVGPVKPEVEQRLAAIPGLVRVGAVPHREVPTYLRAFDVCIQPHVINELRHRSDPLKVIEYLATGRPIVSVALRSLEPLRPVVELASTADDFVRLVAERIDDPRAELALSRRAVAATRNWDTLYLTVAERIERLWRREAR
ncbi:glycosyltransferase [Rhodopseudomonas palustris]|uniref:glycosyltransferase n=1 Tax=Rhodopseudomonas palustris TaxID=1076 RepID=UPI0020CDB019|nr:glycosyltransferase [Rhodopseudomonas palustris]MCP9626311.1 glycosyltransferase [Rhodopseudomonas palustris]